MPKETLINVIFRLAGNFVAEHQPWFDRLTNRPIMALFWINLWFLRNGCLLLYLLKFYAFAKFFQDFF